jgi:hypothetical protein
MNVPLDPVTRPLVVVPSPQLMVAAKLDAVSLLLLPVNVATLVVLDTPHPQPPYSARLGR